MTEPDKINLRDAREEDVPAMAGLLSELFSLEKDFRPDPDKQMRGLRLLLKQPHLGRLFVASTDDGIVGMVSLLFTVSTAEGGPVAILEDMIVANAYRGQGIGRRLVEHVLDRAAKSGRDHTNFTSATGRFGMPSAKQDAPLCRPQQAACDKGGRPNRPRPFGLATACASAALRSLRMEQPFAALRALHPSHAVANAGVKLV